jgi:predicted nucleic acid-binding protein
MQSVYLETTIPSFYFETRTEPEMVARRNWTQIWWQEARSSYEVYISEAVLDELEQGKFPEKQNILTFLEPLPILPVEPEIAEIVGAYIAHHVMPHDPVGDAPHLAIASYHKCDYLLTWNCRPLANANKFHHIQRVNTLLGLFIPLLVTPLELLGE